MKRHKWQNSYYTYICTCLLSPIFQILPDSLGLGGGVGGEGGKNRLSKKKNWKKLSSYSRVHSDDDDDDDDGGGGGGGGSSSIKWCLLKARLCLKKHFIYGIHLLLTATLGDSAIIISTLHLRKLQQGGKIKVKSGVWIWTQATWLHLPNCGTNGIGKLGDMVFLTRATSWPLFISPETGVSTFFAWTAKKLQNGLGFAASSLAKDDSIFVSWSVLR